MVQEKYQPREQPVYESLGFRNPPALYLSIFREAVPRIQLLETPQVWQLLALDRRFLVRHRCHTLYTCLSRQGQQKIESIRS